MQHMGAPRARLYETHPSHTIGQAHLLVTNMLHFQHSKIYPKLTASISASLIVTGTHCHCGSIFVVVMTFQVSILSLL